MMNSNTDSFTTELNQHTSKGWVVISEGPSGAQLEKPRAMKPVDKLALVVGVLTLPFAGVGLIFIIAAVLDYVFFTKAESKFLDRP